MSTNGSMARKGSRVGSPRFVPYTRQQLEALDAQIDALYELLPFGSYCTSSDGTVLSINDAALALLGQERKNVVGKVHSHECFTSESQEQLALLSASGVDNFDDCRLSLLGKDGAIHHVLLSGRSVGEVGGATRSRRFVIKDITESGQATVLRSARAVDILCRHIAINCPPQLTSDQMAALTGLTSRALSYAFRLRFGCTHMEWQRNHFLDVAHQYLTKEDDSASIKSVVRRFGFASSAAFSKFYKRRFGHKPREAGYAPTA